jgi:hypothetical protein
MKTILELLFTCFWVGILFSCCLVLMMFVVGLTKGFYKIYFVKNEVDQNFYNKVNPEFCNHENSRYTESHPDLVWTCNDFGKIH